jgi:hypothetical protein
VDSPKVTRDLGRGSMLALVLTETYAPLDPLTNDGVVVGRELAGLDFGFEFHTILLCVRTFETFGA